MILLSSFLKILIKLPPSYTIHSVIPSLVSSSLRINLKIMKPVKNPFPLSFSAETSQNHLCWQFLKICFLESFLLHNNFLFPRPLPFSSTEKPSLCFQPGTVPFVILLILNFIHLKKNIKVNFKKYIPCQTKRCLVLRSEANQDSISSLMLFCD